MAAFRNDSIFWVEVNKIVPNPYQPRREFDENKLKELSESIRMYGVLQPLTVSRVEVPLDNGAFRTEYELIAGERRLRASRLAGLSQVPVLIREGEESEQEKLELAIIENLQREDLSSVDRALAFRQLSDVFGLSHGQVAKKVGRSREYVSNSIRLLGLPDYMLTSLRVGDISEGHGRTLLMLNDRPEEQDTVFREILLKKLSVREVERIARKIATDKVRVKTWDNSDPELIEKEKQFTETLGTRVQLVKTDYGGKITIDYFSDDDLENFLNMMKQSQKRFMPSVASTIAEEIAETEKETDTALNEKKASMQAVTEATPLELVEELPDIIPVPEEDLEAILQGEKNTDDDVLIEEELEKEIFIETKEEPFDEVVTDEAEKKEEENNELLTTEEEKVNSTDAVAVEAIKTETENQPRSSLRDRLAQFFGEQKAEVEKEETPLVKEEAVEQIESESKAEPEDSPELKKEEKVNKPEQVEEDIYNLKNFGI